MTASMKLAIVIPTYNRAAYLDQCLRSISKSNAPANGTEITVIFVDDGSVDERVFKLISDFYPRANMRLIKQKINKGVHNSILVGVDCAFDDYKVDAVMILDSDTVVSRNWLEALLQLHEYYPNDIVSGFNTLTKDPATGRSRHPIVEQCDGYAKKSTIGGINMLFNYGTYRHYIRPNLSANWDWKVCQWMSADKKMFLVTTPSVIQHIGLEEGMHCSPGINPDVAEDFEI